MNKSVSILVFSLLLCSVASARKFPLAATQVVPAARGDVEVKRDDNGNTKLNTTAEGLRNIDRKLAFAMARVAFVLLYFGLVVIGH